MRIVSKRTLREFWAKSDHAVSQGPLEAWHEEVCKADWDTPQKVKDQFGNASIVGNNRVVFNIKGNDYRLVVQINYPYRMVYIRFIGTHSEYDAINVEDI